MFELSTPYIIILAPIIFILWKVFFRDKSGIIPLNTIMQKTTRYGFSHKFQWCIQGGIVLLLTLLLAGPSGEVLRKIEEIPKKQILIILDISLSMLEEDILPNRLTKAKDIISQIIERGENSEIGFIFFSGKAFIGSPFTTDYRSLNHVISNIHPYTIRQNLPGLSGTALGDALLLGTTFFTGTSDIPRGIILLTDGKANIGIDPALVIEELKKSQIPVYTIGMGKRGNSLSNSSTIGNSDLLLDEGVLKNLGEKTGGNYIYVGTPEDISQLLLTLEKSLFQKITNIRMVRQDYSLHILLLLLIFVIIEVFIRWYHKKRLRDL